jgi:hypothetical protein
VEWQLAISVVLLFRNMLKAGRIFQLCVAAFPVHLIRYEGPAQIANHADYT